MNPEFFRWSRNLSFISISFLTFSCSVGYNSVNLTKSDPYIYAKSKIYSENNKTGENIMLIHSGDSIIQLNSIEFNDINKNAKTFSGNIMDVNPYFIKVYQLIKETNTGRIKEREISGPKAVFLRQTHVFVDSIEVSDGIIQVQERHIREYKAYYP